MSAVPVSYTVAGPPDAPLVVLSNSLGATRAMWDPQVAPLAERFRVVTYDGRGHGESPAPAGPYALVSLLIGVNNQYRGRAVDDYAGQFDALLQRAVALAGDDPGRVLVLAIPDWGVTPFGAHSGRDTDAIAAELDAYNATAAAICAARGAAFVDIAPVSRALGGEAEMLADDGLHPSAALHTEWTRLALPVARRVLSAA